MGCGFWAATLRDGLWRAIRGVAALTNGITIRFAPRLATHPSKGRLGHEGFNQRFPRNPQAKGNSKELNPPDSLTLRGTR